MSEELFVVKHAVGNNPTVYKLQDQAGEDIKGTFYSKDIQKVTEPESYHIERVIRKKETVLEISFALRSGEDITINSIVLCDWKI